MSSHDADERLRRLEEEAYGWVSRIIADRKRHAAGLRDWVGTSEERADIYNRAYRNQTKAKAVGGWLFGDARERQAHRLMAQIRTAPYRRIIGITVALMLVGAVASLAISALTGRLSNSRATSVSTDYATKVGEVRTVTLIDGSQALLDTQTAIRASFTKADRHIDLLRGRAQFSVAHNVNWPFIVQAGGVAVTARGTVFDVDMNRGVEVNLIKGAVDVAYAGHDRAKATTPLRLTAGEHVTIDPTVPLLPVAATHAPASEAQWVTGFKSFDDVPAGAIIDEANRYSKTRIQLESPADHSRLVFLVLQIRNTRKVAYDLAKFLDLDVDESRPGLMVLRHQK